MPWPVLILVLACFATFVCSIIVRMIVVGDMFRQVGRTQDWTSWSWSRAAAEREVRRELPPGSPLLKKIRLLNFCALASWLTIVICLLAVGHSK
jgi:hypothetical protein